REPDALAPFRERFAECRVHLRREPQTVVRRVQPQRRSVDAGAGHCQTAPLLTRVAAARVHRLKCSNSRFNSARPGGVRRYNCLSREESAVEARSIQPSSSSRRSAPYIVPVLRRTRPSLSLSTSFISPYPWRGCSARLRRIQRAGSPSGLIRAALLRETTCRTATYYACLKRRSTGLG